MVKVLFFAQAKEELGLAETKVELDTGVSCDVVQLIAKLIEQEHKFLYLQAPHLFVAVNQTVCDRSTQIYDNDEVAFFPAVTGG